MSYKLCDTCSNVKEQKNLNLVSNTKELWNSVPLNIPILGKREGTQAIEINMGIKNAECLIYYWASKTIDNNLHIEKTNLYENSTNNGLIRLDEQGNCVVNINCPQQYKDNKIAYLNHIHIIVSNKAITKWKKNITTQNILCKINKKMLMYHIKLKDRLVINALSKEYYDKMKIPDSYNLYYKQAKKMSIIQLKKEISKMISNHTQIQKINKKNKLNICDTPIIVYCYDKKCDAGHHLANQLFKAGFTNILDYNEGILGYFGRTRYKD